MACLHNCAQCGHREDIMGSGLGGYHAYREHCCWTEQYVLDGVVSLVKFQQIQKEYMDKTADYNFFNDLIGHSWHLKEVFLRAWYTSTVTDKEMSSESDDDVSVSTDEGKVWSFY